MKRFLRRARLALIVSTVAASTGAGAGCDGSDDSSTGLVGVVGYDAAVCEPPRPVEGGASCALSCTFGLKPDANHCPTCECRAAPCTDPTDHDHYCQGTAPSFCTRSAIPVTSCGMDALGACVWNVSCPPAG